MLSIQRTSHWGLVAFAFAFGIGCSYDPPDRQPLPADADATDARQQRDGQSRDVSSDTTSDASDTEPSDTEPDTRSDAPGTDADTTSDASGTAAFDPGTSCSADADCRSVCVAGSCAHRMFVTSETWTGDLGGLSGADTKCRMMAADAGLGDDWQAVVSVEESWANERTDLRAAVVRMDGRLIAEDGELWAGQIANPVGLDQHGAPIEKWIWTGSHRNGSSDVSDDETEADDCDGWTSSDSRVEAEVGASRASGSGWLIRGRDRDCDQPAALYCIDGQ